MNISTFALLSISLALGACSESGESFSGAGSELNRNQTIASTAEISMQEASDLIFMREEEKLARDVYTTLYQRWNLDIFNNIANAEQKHMNSVGSLITLYHLEDPVRDNTTGSFSNPDLATLYQSLVATGKQSPAAAIDVGKQIEILDISDLQKAINTTSNAAIIDVYQRLLNGSYNHLDAFNAYQG